MEWETVIGLEVHVQLATQTKIFSGASTAFGAEPNTQACAIDLAMPGTLPVANEEAFRFAVMFGLAIDAEIGKKSVFERKNYFYPDLPKGYQTTQLEEPIVGAGHIDIELEDGSTKRVRIHHAHLEEDAGKSLHEDFHGQSGIDLNRAGTPLIEIVSEPDMRSAEEAVAYAKKLHSIVTSLGICDGEMAQGSMRFDVNISVNLPGEEFGTRTETKNLNSFKFMEDAIHMEVDRQIELLESGKEVKQATRLYNGDTKKAAHLRFKENSDDYRYFPCPDLLPIVLDDDYIETIRSQMPELPEAKRQRYINDLGLPSYDAGVLTADAAVASYFESVAESCGEAKLAANWVMGDIMGALNKAELSIKDCPIAPEAIGTLISRIKASKVTSKGAKTVFAELWDGKSDVDEIIKDKGLEPVSDTGALEKIVDDIIANNDKQVENFRKAPEEKQGKMLGFFVGQAMKATKGQADPKQLNEILLKKLREE